MFSVEELIESEYGQVVIVEASEAGHNLMVMQTAPVKVILPSDLLEDSNLKYHFKLPFDE